MQMLASLCVLALTALVAGWLTQWLGLKVFRRMRDTLRTGWAQILMHEAGLRVPQDVAVVGYDDIPMAAFASPPLTTLRTDPIGHGRQAVQLLLSQMRHETPNVAPLAAPRLVVRASCGAVQHPKACNSL